MNAYTENEISENRLEKDQIYNIPYLMEWNELHLNAVSTVVLLIPPHTNLKLKELLQKFAIQSNFTKSMVLKPLVN
jgi:hypothetical protein